MSDFDGASGRLDAEPGGEAKRLTGGIRDGEKKRISAGSTLDEPGAVLGESGKGAVRKIGPGAVIAMDRICVEECSGVQIGTERDQFAKAAGEGLARGRGGRLPIRQRHADWLAEWIEFVVHESGAEFGFRSVTVWPGGKEKRWRRLKNCYFVRVCEQLILHCLKAFLRTSWPARPRIG